MERRKERAKRIAEKEEYAEKRHRLLNVLIQKLLLKHGPKTQQALPKSQISDIVNLYLDKIPSIVNVTSIRNVKGLELELSREMKDVKPRRTAKTKCQSTIHDIGQEEVGLKKKRSSNEHVASCKNTSQQNSRISKEQKGLDISKVNPWSLIETFQIVENENTIEEKKVKAVQKQKDMAAAFHEQIRIKEEASKEEKAEDDKFLTIQRDAIREWEEEKAFCAKVEQEKIAELKKVRYQQVEETKRKRKAEQSEKMSNELREIQNIKLALEKEEQQKHERKQLEREKWDRISLEIALKNEERQRQKEEEAKMDAKLMEDAKRKQDEIERKRINALEERKVKLEVNGQLLSEAGAFNKRKEMIKFEKNLLKAAEARERAQTIREQKKRDIERKKKQQITESNRKMAEERRRREKEIEKENEAYALKCLKEKEALLHEEDAERITQHETKEKYRRVLQEQMEEQKKHKAHYFDGMTVVERSMNKKLMKKLEKSNIRKKILDKVTSYYNISDSDEIDAS